LPADHEREQAFCDAPKLTQSVIAMVDGRHTHGDCERGLASNWRP
jgi:hypothetical protein